MSKVCVGQIIGTESNLTEYKLDLMEVTGCEIGLYSWAIVCIDIHTHTCFHENGLLVIM